MPEVSKFKYEESTTSPLEVELDADEGAIIRDIGVRGGADDEVISVIVDATTVNAFSVAPGSINHCPIRDAAQEIPWIVNQLIKKGVIGPEYRPHFHSKLGLELSTDPDLMYVVLDQREIGNVPAQNTPGGKNQTTYLHVSYGDNGAALDTDDSWFDLTSSKMPAELDDFPFEANSKLDYNVDPLAIGVYSERNVDTRADFLRLLIGGSPIFGEDRAGITVDPMQENYLPYGGAAGDITVRDLSDLPVITADTEVLLQVQANYDGTNSLSAGNCHAFFAGIVNP